MCTLTMPGELYAIFSARPLLLFLAEDRAVNSPHTVLMFRHHIVRGDFPDNIHLSIARANDVYLTSQIRSLKSASTYETLGTKYYLRASVRFNQHL